MTATLTIRQYATAHKLDPDLLVSALEDEHAPDDELEVTALDDVREAIENTVIEDLVEAREALDDARDQVKGCERELQRAIREALADGFPATRVAEVLGVSRARVYQLRDGRR